MGDLTIPDPCNQGSSQPRVSCTGGGGHLAGGGILLSKERKQERRKEEGGYGERPVRLGEQLPWGGGKLPPHNPQGDSCPYYSQCSPCRPCFPTGPPHAPPCLPSCGGRAAEAPGGSDDTQKPWFADTGIQLRILNRSSQSVTYVLVGGKSSPGGLVGPTLLLGALRGLEVLGERFCLPSPTTLEGLEDVVAGSKLCW